MSFKGAAKRISKNPYYLFCSLGSRGLLNWMSDKRYLELFYRGTFGKKLNFENPRTFNEKLQWLKIYDRNPLYTKLVDKCEVKQWVAEKIGREYVVPTLGVWDSCSDIDLDALPNRFVLKCTHDSGGIAICADKKTFNYEAARKKIEASLARNYFWYAREWPYKNVPPRVIAEEYLEPNLSGDLVDYKLFHFNNGRIVTLVCEDRLLAEGMKETFFDEDWHPLPLSEGGHSTAYDSRMPTHFNRMCELANLLASDLPFCRVDFYESSGRLYFGEMTFYPASGFERFDPASVDMEWGNWIDLSNISWGGGWLFVSSQSMLWIHEGLLSRGLIDYKFFCFSGEPRFLYVSQGLENHATARIGFLSLDWEPESFGRGDYRRFEERPERPRSLDEMIELSRILSDGMPFVRVDFYERKGSPLFSEMTFCPCAGLMPFEPKEWDEKIGSLLTLPKPFC